MNKNGIRRGWARALGLWLAAALLGLAVPLLAPATASADGPPIGRNKPVLLLHGWQLSGEADCSADDMWGPALDLFHQWGWTGQVHTMGYYSKNDPYRIGFDCSGLVRWAWSQAVGYDVMGDSTAAGIFSMPGQRLGTDTSALQPGDLVFWGVSNVHHVAVYLGAGKIVEARESDTHVMVSDLTSHNMSDYAGGLRFAAGGTGNGNHMTWGSNVNVHSHPRTDSSTVTTLAGPTAVQIGCQKHAGAVTAEGVSNAAWSYLPAYKAWVSNIYVKGAAWLDGVIDCTVPPALDPETQT